MATYQRKQIHSVEDIMAIADHSGSFFFKPDTMRFFSSRVLEGIHALDSNEAKPGNRFLFITSERHGDNAPRHYAVRMMTLDTIRDGRPAVDIVTIGEYHPSANAARRAAREYAKQISQ